MCPRSIEHVSILRFEKALDDMMLDDGLEPVRDPIGEVVADPARQALEIGGRHLKIVVLGIGGVRRIDADHQHRSWFPRAVGGAAMDGQRRPRRNVAALRENLRRRKAQAREVEGSEPPRPSDQP